jgi:uncharacterized protein (TIGR03000 family)
MKRFGWSTFAGASLGALAFALSAPGSVSAQSWGSDGGSNGSHGSHGSHGSLFSHGSSGGGSHGSLFSHGSSGGSNGSNGGSHGSLFDMFHHGSNGSSGGSNGSNGGSHGSMFDMFHHSSHGSSGGSNGTSGGSNGSSGGYYTASNNSAPAAGYYTASFTSRPAAGDSVASGSVVPTVSLETSTGVAYLNINVPEDAKVYLQGQLMTVSGTQRRFVTPEIQAGTQLVYTVKLEVVRNGQTISKTTQAVVGAGQEIAVSVAFDAEKQNELVATVALLASR